MKEQLKNIDNEEFWKGKQLFDLDEENELDYSTEEDEEDVVDSDFDDKESDESESEVKVEKEKASKRGVYVDPTKRPGKKRAALGGPTTSSASTAAAPRATRATRATPQIPLERRKSSRSSTVESAEALKRKEEASSKTTRKRQKRVPHRVLTQEEQYEEAKETEEINRESLKRLLEEEEKAKKLERVEKVAYTGPKIIFHSKKGQADTVTYTHGDFVEYKTPVPKRAEGGLRCCVTGLVAKYKDPLTKLAYANLKAFKDLRAMYERNPKALASQAEKYGQSLFG